MWICDLVKKRVFTMSHSKETTVSDTATDSAPHGCGLHSSDTAPIPKETRHGESNLDQQLQNLDLKEEEEEPEKKDEGGRLNAVGDDEDEKIENENNDGDDVKKEGRRSNYPVRPEAEDCAYYMKTGLCKFAFNCKFNHPIRRKNQEKVKEQDESTEKTSQQNCKYYLRTGGCKFGKACRYNHSEQNSIVGTILEHNFLGLPIRKGEKECPYYMRNGSCKYGDNCRFNHPDPEHSGEPPSVYGNGGFASSQAASQGNMASWALNDSAAYTPIIFSPTQGVPPPNPEWNGYQTTVHPSLEKRLHPIPAYVMGNPSTETTSYTHLQSQVVVDEFPERPGQPECSYFLKNGDCKFKSNCKYHHPKICDAKLAPCALSNKGLPLRPSQVVVDELPERPGQPECSYFLKNGDCKFKSNCKYHHPKICDAKLAPCALSNEGLPLRPSQVVVDEFPERPGQPECSYFLKNGDCKFKSNCKYHHPKLCDAKLAPCALSNEGLPLRPDQRICLYYSQNGICKFGPACKFDHSIRATPSAVSGLDQPPSFSHSSTTEQAGIGSNCADTAVQQSM